MVTICIFYKTTSEEQFWKRIILIFLYSSFLFYDFFTINVSVTNQLNLLYAVLNHKTMILKKHNYLKKYNWKQQAELAVLMVPLKLDITAMFKQKAIDASHSTRNAKKNILDDLWSKLTRIYPHSLASFPARANLQQSEKRQKCEKQKIFYIRPNCRLRIFTKLLLVCFIIINVLMIWQSIYYYFIYNITKLFKKNLLTVMNNPKKIKNGTVNVTLFLGLRIAINKWKPYI